ncbi:MAG: hypothetical protein K8R28_11490 [Desulfobacterales bacterium]|nr:hypothetical protein [Desulfobacterales bacterium]
MSCKYLITLTPAGRFFFGGTSGFNDDFFVQSEKFPQPTTILGALRASLLIGSNMLLQHKRGRFVPKYKKSKAIKLTGTSRLNNFEEKPDLGVIKNISPVFLVKKESDRITDAFFKAPEDIVKVQTGGFRKVGFNKISAFSCNCLISGKRETVCLSDFDQKNEKRGDFLGGQQFWKEYLQGRFSENGLMDIDEADSPFTSFSQIGIGLKKREVEKGKLYVKHDFKLKKGYAFAVICNVAIEDIQLSENIVMGEEQSVFFINKVKLEDEKALSCHPVIELIQEKMNNKKESRYLNDGKGTQKQQDNPKKLVLISPMVLPENTRIFKDVVHAVIRRVSSVRMLNSFNKNDNSLISEDKKKKIKSDAYRVIPEGSVFFLDENKDSSYTDIMALPSIIGYNAVIELPVI